MYTNREQRQCQKAEMLWHPIPRKHPKTTINTQRTLGVAVTSTAGNIPSYASSSIRSLMLGVCCEQISLPVGDITCGVQREAQHLQVKLPLGQTIIREHPDSPSASVSDSGKYLTEYRKYWLPPWFIVIISIVEVVVYIFNYSTVKSRDSYIPTDSIFIYRPDRRIELWRFISYMVLHANWFHLGINVFIQLLFGVPLELVHGSIRVAVIYLAGVLAGSLGTSVVDSAVYLVGASGGVYALLAAQLVNIIFNYSYMRSGILQLLSVWIFVACDLAFALYNKYCEIEWMRTLPTVSYIAHMTGSLAGFTIGLLVLRNFDSKMRTRLVWWLALGVYASFNIFAIVFNLANTMTAQMIVEKENEVIKQHLLYDFGIP